jgi:hypothetical protein
VRRVVDVVHLDRLVISALIPGTYFIHNNLHACVLIIIINYKANYRYAILFDSSGIDSQLQSNIVTLLNNQKVPIMCQSVKVMQSEHSTCCSLYCCTFVHFAHVFYFSQMQKANMAVVHSLFTKLFNDGNVELHYITLLKQLQHKT